MFNIPDTKRYYGKHDPSLVDIEVTWLAGCRRFAKGADK